MADFVALAAAGDPCAPDLAQRALDLAWAYHAHWPLGLDDDRRLSALSALAMSERSLARMRNQLADARATGRFATPARRAA